MWLSARPRGDCALPDGIGGAGNAEFVEELLSTGGGGAGLYAGSGKEGNAAEIGASTGAGVGNNCANGTEDCLFASSKDIGGAACASGGAIAALMATMLLGVTAPLGGNGCAAVCKKPDEERRGAIGAGITGTGATGSTGAAATTACEGIWPTAFF